MKTLLALLAAAGLLAGAALAQPASPPARQLRVLELKGSAYERGFQHGQQLRLEIARIVALWKADLRSSFKKDPDDFLRRFLAETNFAPAIKRWTPDLWDEVRGLAEGSGQPFDTIYAFQLMDELWVFADQPEPALPRPSGEHCSSLGVARSGRHPAYVAQNMDLETFRDGFQVVLHIAASEREPEQYVLTSAGLIGLNGMNRNSVAITCNTLMELTAAPDGLPVAFVVRGVLAQTSGEAAVGFVHTVRHASGQNYIVGSGDHVYDLEASANKVVPFLPVADGSVVFHTNHPLANDDWKPWHRAKPAPGSLEAKWQANTEIRLTSLQTRLSRPSAAIDEAVIQDTLRARDSNQHPVCRAVTTSDDGFTFAATIMTLSGTPSFTVTMGPPDVNPFVRLEFTADEKP